jgi:hypothetical protein
MQPTDVPAISVVLPTDNAKTIAAVLGCLRTQPEAGRIELVLVTTDGVSVRTGLDGAGDFARIEVVEVHALSPLGPARAAGIRAARAPLVFLGETHCYPQPGWMAELLEAFSSGPWDVVACGMINANPETRISQAGFLADYARWHATLTAGEIEEAPLYNAAYRREVLLALGDRLDRVLSHGDGLKIALQSQGRRSCLAPRCRLAHVNVDHLPGAMRERLLAGILIGSQRAGCWPLWKRLLYAAAAPLIAVVLCRRILPGFQAAARAGGVARGTLPVSCGLQGVRAFGEFLGYLGLGRPAHQTEMDDFEIRKLDHCIGHAP